MNMAEIQCTIHDMRKWLLALVLIQIFLIIYRCKLTANYTFPLWFDPARDALVSRQILDNHDLKIQGPTASGTNDTVFHGVLYYYIVGPLYSIFKGDPQPVVWALIILTSFAIYPIFFLTKELTGSKNWGLLAALISAISYDTFRGASWLSNPVLASLSIPTFFYFYWQVFFKRRTKLWWAMLLSLAVSHQAVILFITQWALVVVGLVYAINQKQFVWKKEKRQLFIGLAVYLAGISTMIISQLRAWWVGIFSLSKFLEFTRSGGQTNQVITGTFQLFLEKFSQSLTPSWPLISILAIGLLLKFSWPKLKKPEKTFFALSLSSPLWLLAWHYRNMNHSLLGLESIIIVMSVVLISRLPKFAFNKYLFGAGLLMIFASNLIAAKSEIDSRNSIYYVPHGAYLREMLDLVDYTYQQANGSPFTISTLTNPLSYNTTWAYLYGWYGQEKYGYKPAFLGPDQVGIFGDDQLQMAKKPAANHFAIYESRPGIVEDFYTVFAKEQRSMGWPMIDDAQFGTLLVEHFEQLDETK